MTSYEIDIYDVYGFSADLSEGKLVICSPGENLNEVGLSNKSYAGACYIYLQNQDSTWSFNQKIVASDREPSDYFGEDISISGSYLLVGSPSSDLDENQSNFLLSAGSAYLFERNLTGKWIEKQKLVAHDRQTDDEFGYSLRINGDVAVISSLNDFDTSGINFKSNAGSVYVFEKNGSGLFIEKQKLQVNDRDIDQNFGYQIIISAGNQILLTYASGLDESGLNFISNAGAVQIFEKNVSGLWVAKQKIVAPLRNANDAFGSSISMSASFMAISAKGYDYDINGQNYLLNAGMVYLFKIDGNGIWKEYSKFTAPDRKKDENFGHSLSINDSILIVGSPRNCTDENFLDSVGHTGAIYIYRLSGTGDWVFSQKLVNLVRHPGAWFGDMVCADGMNILGCAPFDKVDAKGSAGSCTYFTANDTGTTWVEEEYATSFEPEIKLFPNPNHGSFQLQINRSVSSMAIVYNNLGEVVYKQWINGDKASLTLPEDQSPGIYFLKLNDSATVGGHRFVLIGK